jgi:hypothetical protein
MSFNNPLKSVPSVEKKAETPSFLKEPDYAITADAYLAQVEKLAKQRKENEEFLTVVGTEGHTNGPEKDAETMRFLKVQLNRIRDQEKELEKTYRAGQNLETEEEKAKKKVA